MLTPKSRQEMERHVCYVLENAYRHLQRGTSQALALTGRHLREVRTLPNQRLHLATVNQSLRLQANTLATFQSPEFRQRFADLPEEEST